MERLQVFDTPGAHNFAHFFVNQGNEANTTCIWKDKIGPYVLHRHVYLQKSPSDECTSVCCNGGCERRKSEARLRRRGLIINKNNKDLSNLLNEKLLGSDELGEEDSNLWERLLQGSSMSAALPPPPSPRPPSPTPERTSYTTSSC